MSARHRHYCIADCGEWLTCSQDADVCPRDWTCPTCEQAQRDEFFQLVAETEPEPAPQLSLIPELEPTRR